ncbi:MAG: helix-turn-helix transcriptional regulator [Christensenellales bacterium]
MHWIDDVQKAINFIEENLLEDISPNDVSGNIYASKDHFQRIFNVVTGFSVSEYIRNRRLSLAGRELVGGRARIIDVALKYRYETPESFTKAFSRFHGVAPSSIRTRERLKTFDQITIQITIQGGFGMSVKLDVRSVGFLNNLKNDMRSPESFALPACMTSLMEYIGEDARWQTIHAHNRVYTKRKLYDAILAASGMAFGLLWHPEVCPSSFDLTQVNDHNATITHAFDYVGYGCEIVEKTEGNFDEMKSLVTQSIDAGKPVLAFGIVGPPECAIVCGYDSGGDTLFGWSHFQSYEPADCEHNGMFRKADWHGDVWKIVLCKDKKEPDTDLKAIIRRGIAITSANELDGLYSGAAAYDAWAGYVANPAYDSMSDDELRGKFWFHHMLVGNHAEARCYLGGFLHESAGDDEALHKIANLYNEIHDTCWQVWAATDGFKNPDNYKAFREKSKRDKVVKLIRKIEELDFLAIEKLRAWLDN